MALGRRRFGARAEQETKGVIDGVGSVSSLGLPCEIGLAIGLISSTLPSSAICMGGGLSPQMGRFGSIASRGALSTLAF